jgi:uncharacterized phage protein (TIGR01671 family)
MNRPIEFRAWDKEFKKFVEILGIYWISPDMPMTCHVKVWHHSSYSETMHRDVGQYIELQQFTGLIDKNGKNIFEGDILSIANIDNAYVKFINDGFKLTIDKVESCLDLFFLSKVCFVIGNIYENPELIK